MQYASKSEKPIEPWSEVKTTLADINTTRVHYIKPPSNMIVIDFDLKDENGEKSQELNLEAASKWPPTYAEFSKSGSGVHLHYIYTGDIEQLHSLYSPGIEVKTFKGNASLRRKLTKCNDIPMKEISSGLPLKGAKKMDFEVLKNERALRKLIANNLLKKYHPATKPSIDFIYKLLEDAYNSGMTYDVSNMYNDVLEFAMNSTNNAEYCMKKVTEMHFMSADSDVVVADNKVIDIQKPIAFYDVEVYLNLFVVVWKVKGETEKHVLVNPTPVEISNLVSSYRLVGFNCRRYDNHICYAKMIGYTLEQLFELSQKIIKGGKNNPAFFREAYNLSYTDIYDFADASHKQSLKKFEIDLSIHHQEMGIPWDKPVDKKLWPKVIEYCGNDVDATECVWDYLEADWIARQILSELSGLNVNATTNMHTTKIIFGNATRDEVKAELQYTDLSEMFPGYVFDHGKSTYRGEETGEGANGYAIGKVNNLLTPLSYDVDVVESITVTDGGADEESEDSLRERIRLAPESFSNAGSKGAYRFHTLSAHQSVTDVEVLSTSAGVVDIYPLTATGNPTPEMIQIITDYLSADKVRPLTDRVVVHAPEKIDFTIVANLTLYLDADADAVQKLVNERLNEYKEEMSSKLGKDIVPTQIIAILNSIYGVYKVELLSPAYQVLSNNQWANLQSYNISIGGRANE